MKIESIKGPAAPTLMGQTYAFMLDKQGRYVADVMDGKAIACFVARDDHYRVLGDDPLPAAALAVLPEVPPPLPVAAPAEPLGWAGLYEPTIGINGDAYTTSLVLLEVIGNCALTYDLWNTLSPIARRRLFEATMAEQGHIVHDPAVPLAPNAEPQVTSDPGVGQNATHDGADDDTLAQTDVAEAKLAAARERVETRKAALDGLPADASAENRAACQKQYDDALDALEKLKADLAALGEPAESSAEPADTKPRRSRKPKPAAE